MPVIVLCKMKEAAATYLGRPVAHPVLSVPAYFNDVQRQTTVDAETVAALYALGIINEPNAAAIADALDKNDGESQIIVYDMGGGTFDVSLLSIDDASGVFEVSATGGDPHVAGEDFENRDIDLVVQAYGRADRGKATGYHTMGPASVITTLGILL